MDAPREVPFHESANRPNLLLGGDRELVLVFAIMAAMLVFAVMKWWSVLAGIALWLAAVGVLARMGKADPLLRHVYLRHIRYRSFYPAKSRFTEHRRHAIGLADLLLYDALIEDGVLLLQDGALLAAWKFRGPDLGSATNAEMATLSARLGAILKFGSGWMVQCDSIRSQAPGYPEEQQFPDSITRLIDDERKEQFMAEGAHFESEYFLSLTYLPPVAREERVKGWMFEGMKREQGVATRVLEHFKARLTAFEDVFTSIFAATRLKSVVQKDARGNTVVYDELLR